VEFAAADDARRDERSDLDRGTRSDPADDGPHLRASLCLQRIYSTVLDEPFIMARRSTR